MIRLGGLVLIASVLLGAAPAAPGAAPSDFSDWHLPVPAGDWLISRGPCHAATPFDHNCGYYEERCAIDLIPTSGSMESVPVLAPQSGRVFFWGTRDDAGLTLMLEHAGGRVSSFMHLSRVVVRVDQEVHQGQVIGYAGSTGSSGKAHLHFFVQPNAVERECLILEGLDEIDFRLSRATSHNLDWTRLTLRDLPAELPAWLPGLTALAPLEAEVVLPAEVVIPPGASVSLPVGVALRDATGLHTGQDFVLPAGQAASQTIFSVPLKAPRRLGNYQMPLLVARGDQLGPEATLHYAVRFPARTQPSQGILLVNPAFVRPASWSTAAQPPELCWSVPESAGRAPLRFRAVVAGPTPADSGWIKAACWQTPALEPGTYYWKVFVRDARGYMNRTNQRPYAFVIR